VQQEGAVAHGDDVLRPRFIRAAPQLLRVQDFACAEQPLEQLGARALERARLERGDHPLLGQKVAQLHVAGEISLTSAL